jgi:hypothetical protein
MKKVMGCMFSVIAAIHSSGIEISDLLVLHIQGLAEQWP